MATNVILTAIHGPLKDQEFVFDHPAVIDIGRSRSCEMVLPGDSRGLTVSRHHCRLEIDPPLIRICDLGSLNGTYVNGKCIGSRDQVREGSCFSLDEGDAIQVGSTILTVRIEESRVSGSSPIDFATGRLRDSSSCFSIN